MRRNFPRFIAILLAPLFAATAWAQAVDDVARGKADTAKAQADTIQMQTQGLAGGLRTLEARVAALEARAPSYTDVRAMGATGNGCSTDDTAAIRAAITATPDGGVVVFPPGHYCVTDALYIDRPMSVTGTGRGSQIYQSALDKHLFVFDGVDAVSVRDLYLGSAATAVGTSLIKLINTHRSRFDNVILLGAYYGVHLQGALLNTFVGLSSGINIGGFFGVPSTNQAWVRGDRFNNISANANTFVSIALEGGTNGISLEDSSSEGSLYLYGGTIEGVSGTGLHLKGTGLASLIAGLHLEANGVHDVLVENAAHVRLASLFATTGVEVAGTSRNTELVNSLVEKLVIGATARRTVLGNIEYDLSGLGGIEDNATDTQYAAVSAVNPVDWFGTVGIGVQNPSSNPVGLTPNLKLDVDGRIRAQAFDTGDILFYKDKKPLWRMYEAEDGMMLEDVRTGTASRIYLERDLAPLQERLRAQASLLLALQEQLQQLTAAVRATSGTSPATTPRP
jgi:Pectate lyase superfamily protein